MMYPDSGDWQARLKISGATRRAITTVLGLMERLPGAPAQLRADQDSYEAALLEWYSACQRLEEERSDTARRAWLSAEDREQKAMDRWVKELARWAPAWEDDTDDQ